MNHDQRDLDGGDERLLDPADAAFMAQLLPPLDDRPGPARRRSTGASGAMVAAVVDAALAQRDAVTMAMESPLVVPLRSRSRGRSAMLAAAAVALFSLGAGAAVLVARVIRTAPAQPPAPRVNPVPARAPAVAAPVVEEPAPEVVEPEPTQPEPAAVVPPGASAKRHVVTHKRHRAAPKVVDAPVASNWLEEVDLASAPLEDLLALANRLRRGHEWRSADEVYQAVIDRFPGSDAAVVAEIASATLHVEQLKDASGALDGYRRALAARPSGALAEEARWGIVEALRALGDKPAEVSALRDFLEHHPVSALVPAARRRTVELAP
jgi:hypothetical protein